MKKPKISEEEELRTSTDSWIYKLERAFADFNLFSDDFRREATSNAIKEVAKEKKISLEKATKLVDKQIIDSLEAYILCVIAANPRGSKAIYDLFRTIKAGRFNEFINI